MKINAYIIQDFCKSVSFTSRIHSDSQECTLSRPGFFMNNMEFLPKNIYIADPNEILSFSSLPSGICFALTSPPSEAAIANCPADLLISKVPTTKPNLLSAIMDVFDIFNNWELTLHDCFVSSTPLQDIGECSLLLFRNPVGIYTNTFRILCYYECQKPSNHCLYQKSDVDTYIEEDSINELMLHPDFEKSWSTSGVNIFTSTDQLTKCLYKNLKINGKYLCRVVMNEFDNPCRKSDYAILSIFSTYAEKVLQIQKNFYFGNHPIYMDQMILEMVLEQPCNEELLKVRMDSIHWGWNDTYYCYKILSPKDFNIGSVNNICSRLESLVPFSYTLPIEGSILFIINLSKQKSERKDIDMHLALYLRDYFIKAGISNEFHDFSKLAEYYKQTEVALEIGQHQDSTRWFYHFRDYVLQYIKNRCTRDLKPETICCPGLLKLLDYDRQKNRDYANTLRIYLENNMNIAETTRRIYMQRATFLYQIKKIQEISGLDLSDFKTRLYLMLSFHLLEQ